MNGMNEMSKNKEIVVRFHFGFLIRLAFHWNLKHINQD